MYKVNRRPTPFDGRPGWWNRLNRALYPIMGPSNLGPGVGVTDPPIADPTQERCPLCDGLIAAHTFERSTDGHTATRMYCP